jgi:hypothetical protein
MKFLILLGAAAIGVLFVWWLVKGRPNRPARPRTLAELASPVLSLVLIAAAAYLAHRLGIFTLPLVVLAFVPFGIAARWYLVATRDSRERRALESRPARQRLWDKVALPVLAVMVVAIAVLGVVVGALIGPQ